MKQFKRVGKCYEKDGFVAWKYRDENSEIKEMVTRIKWDVHLKLKGENKA